MSDLIRREDVLKAIRDALVVNPAHDGARRLAGYIVRALPAVQPKVKLLVWRQEAERLWESGPYRIVETLSPKGKYHICRGMESRILDTLEAAQAAVQANHEVRIRSELEPAVQPDAAAIREAALREAWGVAADETDRLRTAKNNHAHKFDTKGEAMAEGAFRVVVALADLIDNPGKEVTAIGSDRAQTDTAPAGLSAGGGADYDAVRQAIQKMTRLEGEYHIDRESADRALAFLNAREAKNCPAPRLLVEDGSVILTWVIGGWKMYQYCDEEETQAFSWQGPPATERGA